MNSRMVSKWWLASVLVLLVSCGESPLFTKSVAFDNNEWKQDQKAVFEVNIPDTTQFYTITITLRTTTDYAYNNMWFFLHSKTPKGQEGREPVEMKIAHPDGSWIGEKSGTVVTTVARFSHRRFPQQGKYRFTFEQGVTENSVKDILDISYTVTKDQQQ